MSRHYYKQAGIALAVVVIVYVVYTTTAAPAKTKPQPTQPPQPVVPAGPTWIERRDVGHPGNDIRYVEGTLDYTKGECVKEPTCKSLFYSNKTKGAWLKTVDEASSKMDSYPNDSTWFIRRP